MGFIREREAFGMAEIFVRKFAEESLPKNLEKIEGVGKAKIEKYGRRVLDTIAAASIVRP